MMMFCIRYKLLRVVVPESDHEDLFMKVHAGEFGGHLKEAKIHSQLNCHYWWPTIRQGGVELACFTCASCNVGKPLKPFFTPIPVGGPFDRVGFDALQLPKSSLKQMDLWNVLTLLDMLSKTVKTGGQNWDILLL